MILAGIVLYNPQLERLEENIKSIGPQVDKLVFIDNASVNIHEINNLLDTIQYEFILISNKKNKGIAAALNQLLQYGEQNGAEWVLTLDQDSVCPNNIIEMYLKCDDAHDVGIICPIINDRGFGVLSTPPSSGFRNIEICITSASLTSIKAWRAVGGFDESMFIDGVDTDFCLSLRENGYKILQCQNVELLHEIGHNSKIISICGHKQAVFHHSAFRYYHICRNIIYNNRKHRGNRPSPLRGLITVLYRLLLILAYENNKIAKSKAVFKGLIDGFKSPIYRGQL